LDATIATLAAAPPSKFFIFLINVDELGAGNSLTRTIESKAVCPIASKSVFLIRKSPTS